VVGEGRNFTLEMVNNAVDRILSGAKFIATNLEPSLKKEGWTNPWTKWSTYFLQSKIKPLKEAALKAIINKINYRYRVVPGEN